MDSLLDIELPPSNDETNVEDSKVVTDIQKDAQELNDPTDALDSSEKEQVSSKEQLDSSNTEQIDPNLQLDYSKIEQNCPKDQLDSPKIEQNDSKDQINFPKKIDLIVTAPNEQINNTELPTEEKAKTNTDNLLNLNLNFPKVTVLGREQAKRRLQAFSSAKQSSSPTAKKFKQSALVNQSLHDNKDNVKVKKGLSAEERAKCVIKEIEDIKKAQRSDSKERENSQPKFRGKFKDKLKNKSKLRKYTQKEQLSLSAYKFEEIEYPVNWKQFHSKCYSLDFLKDKIHNVQSDKRNCYDYKRQANFEMPSLPVSNYKYRDVNGEEKNISYNYIRYTYKSSITIPYNPNIRLKIPRYFSRQHYFSIINKSLQEEILKLINSCTSDRREKLRPLRQRSWYPKSALDNKKECEILEHSMGLSILRAYSDEEEEEDEEEKVEDNHKNKCNSKLSIRKNKKSKSSKRKSHTPDRSHKIHKAHKKHKKLKKNKKIKKSKRSKHKHESDSESDEEKSSKRKYPKEAINEERTVKEVKREIVKEESEKGEHDVKDKIFLSQSNIAQVKREKQEEALKDQQQKDEEMKNRKTTINEDNISHWESDEDVVPQVNNAERVYTWENKTTSIAERSLEMPLTIEKFTRRTYVPKLWEERDLLKVKQLEEERKEIEEERKKLELEKKRLAELEKLYKMNLFNSDKPLVNANTSLLNLSNLSDISTKEKENEISFKIKEEKLSDDDNSLKSSSFSTSKMTTDFTPLNDTFDLVNKTLNDSCEKDQSVLETEYEEFLRDISQQNAESKKQTISKKRKYSTSSSSSSSSDSEASSDSTPNQKESSFNFDIQSKDENADLPDAPLPIVKDIEIPKPVPVPTLFSLKDVLGSNNTALIRSNNDDLPTQPFAFTKISLPTKKNLLENSAFNDSEDSNNSDFTQRFTKKDSSPQGNVKVDPSDAEDNISRKHVSRDEDRKDSYRIAEASSKRSRSREPDVKNDSPSRRRRRDSPRNYKRKEYSPRRKRESPNRRKETTPKRNLSPRRRSSPRRRKARDRSYSPRNHPPRNISPRNRSPRNRSPRSHSPRDRSPRNYSRRGRSPRNYSPKRIMRRDNLSPSNRLKSPERRRNSPRKEPIQITLQRIAGMEDYPSNKSPIDSPLGGFKRSVADSTISDEQLLQHNNYSDSPYNAHYYQRNTESPSSPRRISLDDRINQVLGIEKETSKQTNQMYQQDYNYSYYNHYGTGQYNNQYNEYGNYQNYNPVASTATNKVLQVGNVLQVVPTEEASPILSSNRSSNNNNNNKKEGTAPKIVQVGNMLQIVPTELPQTTTPSSTTTDKVSAEALMKQKNAERRAEREKRRSEREKRRKEKERKRKEKEKRRQLKLKLKTENMIKRALLLEAEENEGETIKDIDGVPSQWPPAPIVISTSAKNIGKGILLSHGFGSNTKSEEDFDKKKSVKFADGIIPGEGTSPSGGEELTSPPPMTQKLPKEKRFTKIKKPKKIKVPKKKKIKVKIVRTNNMNDLEEDEEDNLPPPSPPPGSPPPHIYPPRIKVHAINNIHSSFQANLPTLPVNNSFTSYRPQVPRMSHPHHQHGNHHTHGGHHHPSPSLIGCHNPPPGPCHPPHQPHCGPPQHHHSPQCHVPQPPPPHHHHHHHHHEQHHSHH